MRKLKITPLRLDGTFVIETNPFSDSRGLFARFFCQNELSNIMGEREIVNVNFSRNFNKGAVRGLHFQIPPFAEVKMPRCIKGKIIDFFVDVRKDSPTFLQWDSIELSEENQKMVFIPEGFAHGFQSLEDNTEIIYLSTEFYSNQHEGSLNFMDPMLKIQLPLPISEISEKDHNQDFIQNINFEGIKI